MVQGYAKRTPGDVIDWLQELAEKHDRHLMVRLVKGAYWDREIKRAQVEGLRCLPGLHAQIRRPMRPISAAQKLFD